MERNVDFMPTGTKPESVEPNRLLSEAVKNGKFKVLTKTIYHDANKILSKC